MMRFRYFVLSFVASIIIVFANAAPQNSKSMVDNAMSSGSAGSQQPPPPAMLPPSSLFDIFLSQPGSNMKQGSYASADHQASSLFGGLSPTVSPDHAQKQQKLSPVLGGLDFGQLTQLCQTMAAMNRAKKMNDAARSAVQQPNDPTGWITLIRQTEPIIMDNFACKMIERVITSPQDFVADLLRLFMPAATANMIQQQIPSNFGLPPTPALITTPNPPVSNEQAASTPVHQSAQGKKKQSAGR